MKPAILVVLVLAVPAFAQKEPPANPFEKWEKDIAAIEKRLKDAPPKKGGVFFAGSSSIRQWKLKEPFPEAANVGFGGSVIRDTTHFAARILLPHEPATIVFYAGDNDIANNRKPEQVRDDFQAFAKLIHDKLPKSKILWLTIKPSLKRWEMFDQQKAANALVKELCDKDTRLVYVDVVPVMLGTDGKPIPDLFVKDGLHMTDKGYALWNDLVKKHLK